ncbi:Sulfide dehydrogenase subunit alpha [uncultured archaeon]|nr:Sulfide dehydrogenase subunit alpha [uncultured archaeon]
MAEKLVIIGSGPAGLSAAMYAAREGFNPLVIGGFEAGGQLLLTTTVENFPGFPDGVQGYQIIDLMRKQAVKFGARFVDKDVSAVDFKSRPLKVTVEGTVYESDSVIVATGANAKMLGLESESKYMGKGVSSCATCDAAFFKNRDVVVVGGGDTAMEDAQFLTRFASSVTIVHRRDAFRASKIMQDRTLSNPKIKVIWNSTIEEIKGTDVVTSVRLKNLVSNDVTDLPVGGVFIAIGYEPNSQMFKGQLTLDDQGYIVTKDGVKTEVDGVFVAGDVSDKIYRQASVASGDGVKAALQARKYLMEK